MSTTEIIAIAVVAIVVIAIVAWYAGQRRRTEQLRDRFGTEYDRTVKQTGDQRAAERDLESRQQRVERLHITALDPRNREAFAARWRKVQADFVDQPALALAAADGLIAEVMRARGYPVGDFDQRAADISVDHPQVVDHYRTAHAIAVRQRAGAVDTEAMRQAMVHYRALFADLLDAPDMNGASTTSTDRTFSDTTTAADAPMAPEAPIPLGARDAATTADPAATDPAATRRA